ncbi:hypothetical protein QSJ19_02915 [Gordonia sp. ABSL11-1]|uniref:hypothetical protein n=1 Tax=Gordonia sp. ABSL11-1 TaxID=3053924 RepID=UPI002572DD4A|nr:hypothetical protein [Gordonia sp. ABSL11-1]MDL9944552.1 hypothetical protein [Gordonia sp. ABSL11-1]
MNPDGPPQSFVTRTKTGENRTAGLLFPADADLSKFLAGCPDALRRPNFEVSAWGKAAVVDPLTRSSKRIEVLVYQDGISSALVPCGNAVVAAAAAYGRQWPEAEVVAYEPRSGYRYQLAVKVLTKTQSVVSGHVEFSVGFASRFPDHPDCFQLDNYLIILGDHTRVERKFAEKLEHGDRMMVCGSRNLYFINSHGRHGSYPITGIIALARMMTLGLIESAEVPGIDQLGLVVEAGSRPGARSLRLPQRVVEIGEFTGG